MRRRFAAMVPWHNWKVVKCCKMARLSLLLAFLVSCFTLGSICGVENKDLDKEKDVEKTTEV